ncbi:hypothetical protein SERLA73DRAFT_186797 [Serpula lacrymans var. lacrymans S7.3]|uniref:Uncharacterized protein n=2 Tax=Serpula lacrymans var. lacrymans TaxID=341189 RepID=F8Q7W4_SERL3|nr:uncharacterized protein SERLADRAFT_476032 [Serpula lacrymans var. lacrymans S7.9]EGN95652.1 hypothetical protein SERLA73DRAFT_186797 [Serpula lacrymans var. lacrymans S7.3]EGO21179.1 hypothetical protein SERLADRAFT_476032 [Serpula lacrymans var. lacrymans S7.9]
MLGIDDSGLPNELLDWPALVLNRVDSQALRIPLFRNFYFYPYLDIMRYRKVQRSHSLAFGNEGSGRLAPRTGFGKADFRGPDLIN